MILLKNATNEIMSCLNVSEDENSHWINQIDIDNNESENEEDLSEIRVRFAITPEELRMMQNNYAIRTLRRYIDRNETLDNWK